jgi:hypothetical protein
MDELLLSRRLIEIVIAVTLIEAVALTVYHRVTGNGVAPKEFGANLVAGLCLMLALRGVLAGNGWGWTALLLVGSGLAHGSDLWRRWKR